MLRSHPRAVRSRALARVAAPAAAALALAACGDRQTLPQSRDDYVPPAVPPLSCIPNLDGRIDAVELKPAIGATARYLVNPVGKDRTIDTLGTTTPSGVRRFDWSLDFADDQVARIRALPVAGQWYAASFPRGAFTTPLDVGGSIDAVYVHDERALWLVGIASALPAPREGKTLVVYDDPVGVFRFPIAPGAAWSSVGVVKNATLRGLPYAGKDTYESRVDAIGELVLHDYTFRQVHRVRTRVTVAPAAGVVVTRRQVSFVAECFGEVARATSRDDETTEDFNVAAELRRLGL